MKIKKKSMLLTFLDDIQCVVSEDIGQQVV